MVMPSDPAGLLASITPDSHIRQIRNIEFDYGDLRPLVTHAENRLKVPSTCMNVFAAIVQDECQENTDFLYFSSWLGPLAAGKIENVRSVGTIEEHVNAACPQGVAAIPNHRYWCFPLCGGRPLHWILSIVDFETKTISIFDSLGPAFKSARWAIPLSKSVVNAICHVLGLSDVDWEGDKWGNMLHSPPPSERQCDSWSCGLFVMMAMRAFAREGFSFECCTNSRIDEIREDAMRAMVLVKVTRYYNQTGTGENLLKRARSPSVDIATGDEGEDCISKQQSTNSPDSDVEMRNTVTPKESVELAVSTTVEESQTLSLGDNNSLADSSSNSGQLALDTGRRLLKKVKTSLKKKLKNDVPSSTEDDPDTDDGKATAARSKAAHGTRAKKLSDNERRCNLEQDPWTETVEVDRVLCNACHKWIKLESTRRYHLKNWDTHKKNCKGITGVVHKRTVEKRPRLLGSASDHSIMSFFKPKTKTGNTNTSEPAHLPVVEESSVKTKYVVKTVKTEPSIVRHLTASGSSSGTKAIRLEGRTKPAHVEPAPKRPCQGLTGGEYEEYVLRTHTRSLGGVAPKLRAQVARQLFPYKPFPLRRSELKAAHRVDPDSESDGDSDSDAGSNSESDEQIEAGPKVPHDGNAQVPNKYWTAAEHKLMDRNVKAFARWEVDYESRAARSTVCHRLTINHSQICDACGKVAQDSSFKDAVHRKFVESTLPPEEQTKIHANRVKYAPYTLRDHEGRSLKTHFKDPLITDILNHLERDQNTDCFLKLYKYAIDGKLQKHETFVQICDVLANRVRRLSSSNANLKYGQRYPENYLNFMTLLRSYGQNSARQYAIVTAQICGPSSRHLQSLVAKSSDALQNPALIFENMARVKRFVDAVAFSGPIAVAGDCTKVRPRLAYSTSFGAGHILGSTLPLEECTVKNSKDVNKIVDKIKSSKSVASQVRAILAKIPLPEVPPTVIALLPTAGSDTASSIHAQHMQILSMAAQLGLPIVSFAADGAASELAAQVLMDSEKSEVPPMVYENRVYGVFIKAVVFSKTGPLVSITDPSHAMKTGRNQPQHGTHNATFGNSFVVNNTLVEAYKTGRAGLQLADVQNVDKQDDGAARRIFHHQTLLATTYEKDGEVHIHEEFRGLFAYLFVFGELYDAWLNRRLDVHARLTAALRARFFLHIWRSHVVTLAARYPDLYSTARSFISAPSFNIFNRLCDTLISLALIYAKYYPNIPFCPWLLGTEYVEHFFGLARTMLPNFTYSQFLALVKHVMIRQRILLSGKFDEKKERTSRTGYIFDFDNSPLTREELAGACVRLTTAEVDTLVETGYLEASSLSEDLLSMVTPPLPFQLIPLSGPPKRGKSTTSVDPEPELDTMLGEGTEDEVNEGASGAEPGSASWDLSEAVAIVAADAARDSTLLDARDAGDAVAGDAIPDSALPKVELPTPQMISSVLSPSSGSSSSTFIVGGQIVLQKVLDARHKHQSRTSVKSQRTIMLDPKFSAAIAATENEINAAASGAKLSTHEGSHLVRLAQDLDPEMRKPKTDRELHWQGTQAKRVNLIVKDFVPNLPEKNINALNMLQRDSFVLMRSKTPEGCRFYIGEVLDLYKQGACHRHGSVDAVNTAIGLSYLALRVYLPLTHSRGEIRNGDLHTKKNAKPSPVPAFSCMDDQYILFTHAKASDLLYNLGSKAFEGGEQRNFVQLTLTAASTWGSLARAAVHAVLED